MLLKLRHLADARAHAKADWGEGEHHCPTLPMGYICLQPQCPPWLCPARCCAGTGTGWGQVTLS